MAIGPLAGQVAADAAAALAGYNNVMRQAAPRARGPLATTGGYPNPGSRMVGGPLRIGPGQTRLIQALGGLRRGPAMNQTFRPGPVRMPAASRARFFG